MSLENTVARMLQRDGADYVLKNRSNVDGPNAWTNGERVETPQTVRARERSYKTSDMRGGLDAAMAEIWIDPATCSAPPLKGAKIGLVSDGLFREIVNVDARRENGAVRVFVVSVKR